MPRDQKHRRHPEVPRAKRAASKDGSPRCWRRHVRDPHNRLPPGSLDGLERFVAGYPNLDAGIRRYVAILRSQGIETFQSCEGGEGHAYPEPTIEFHGGPHEGPRAIGVALAFALPAAELRRVWSMQNGEMVGPHWALTFWRKGEPLP